MMSRRTPVTGGARPAKGKRPSVAVGQPTAGISWRYGRFDHDGPWPICGVDESEHREILDKLAAMEKSTCAELGGGRGLKFISAESMHSDAQRRLSEISLDDFGGLWELHFGGKPRMWCTREQDVLTFVWWDPKHQVCPSKKRNT